MNSFFSGDIHNFHDLVRISCNRPFKTNEEQEDQITENFNSRIKKSDHLYLIGDVAMKSWAAERILKRLNGQIHFILGNHDWEFINILKQYCVEVVPVKDIKICGQKINLYHYAGRVWNCSHRGGWQCHAHSHSTLLPVGLQHDCGIDNNNYFPIEFEELKVIMSRRKQHHTIENGKSVVKSI